MVGQLKLSTVGNLIFTYYYTSAQIFSDKTLCFQTKFFPDYIMNEIEDYKNHNGN